MVLLKRFCFIFSIRLGSIIIGSFSFLGNLATVVLLIIWVRTPEIETRNYIESRIADKDTIQIKDIIAAVSEDPALFSQLGLLASIAYSVSCILEIYGAYKIILAVVLFLVCWAGVYSGCFCSLAEDRRFSPFNSCKEIYLLPFIVLTLLLYVSFIGLHVISMMLVKDNSQDLGLLIGATLFGSFLLMFMFYCLACVYSLWQVLRKPELRELAEENTRMISNNTRTNGNTFEIRSQPVPNLRDDLRYTRRSPHAIPSVSRFNLGGGAGPSGMTFTQEEISMRRQRYTSRLAFPSGYPSTTTSYGALISPVY